MPNQPKTPARTVRLDDELWNAVQAKAEADGTSASDIVRAALRKYLGLALVALVLTGCGGNARAATETHKPTPVAIQPAKFTADKAREFAAITGGTPLKVASRWACNQPMQISVAAPQGFEQQTYRALDYTVTYLQALGYTVGMAAPTAYQSDVTEQPEAGTVLVVVAPYHQDQATLGNNEGTADLGGGSDISSAIVFLDGSSKGLHPDVILHEFGHVLGLDHREFHSVMSAGWDNSGHFDAAETATVSCR